MNARGRTSTLTLLATGAFLVLAVALTRDNPALAQLSGRQTLNDPVAQLDRQLERGEVSLDFRPGSGYLKSLLDRLGVNVDSQVLVFSKTSFQQRLISPRSPRAVFFNDKVAVGSVQGGDVLELMSLDPSDKRRLMPHPRELQQSAATMCAVWNNCPTVRESRVKVSDRLVRPAPFGRAFDGKELSR